MNAFPSCLGHVVKRGRGRTACWPSSSLCSRTAHPPLLPTCLRNASTGLYGGRELPFTTTLQSHPPAAVPLMEVYRVMEEDGSIREGAEEPVVDRDTALRMYTTMMRLQVMDTVFYEAQRQGRISFYMTNWGEEATHIGTAMEMRDDDEVFAQYREVGVLMWRGFTLQNFADQLFSNRDDPGKGRQMPVHYGSARLHFQTISSPLATQIPQAVGAGYACKLEGRGRIAVCYFGEGAASEGDFHAALNMAATLSSPVVFVCRNNGYAISTPAREQYAGDGIAARGVAYGMHTMRVDGNDVWAVRQAMRLARQIAAGTGGDAAAPADGTPSPAAKQQPVLIEAMTYREGHHSTSDDSTRYRTPEEIKEWRDTRNPVQRLRRFLERRGWWDADKEAALQGGERKAVLAAMAAAEKKPKPDLKELFGDVYAGPELMPHLKRQRDALEEHIAKYPEHYAAEVLH